MSSILYRTQPWSLIHRGPRPSKRHRWHVRRDSPYVSANSRSPSSSGNRVASRCVSDFPFFPTFMPILVGPAFTTQPTLPILGTGGKQLLGAVVCSVYMVDSGREKDPAPKNGRLEPFVDGGRRGKRIINSEITFTLGETMGRPLQKHGYDCVILSTALWGPTLENKAKSFSFQSHTKCC